MFSELLICRSAVNKEINPIYQLNSKIDRILLALITLDNDFIAIKGDVTNMHDLEHIFKSTFDQLWKIDALVVNAGGSSL